VIVFGNTSLFCAITYAPDVKDIPTKLTVLFIIHGLPIGLGCLVTFFGYLLAIRNIRRISKDLISHMDISVYKLLWYPGLLFVTFTPGLVNNFVTIITGGAAPLGVQILYLILTHSIGLTNAMVYGFQRKLYHSSHKVKDDISVYKNDALSGSVTKDLMSAGFDDF